MAAIIRWATARFMHPRLMISYGVEGLRVPFGIEVDGKRQNRRIERDNDLWD